MAKSSSARSERLAEHERRRARAPLDVVVMRPCGHKASPRAASSSAVITMSRPAGYGCRKVWRMRLCNSSRRETGGSRRSREGAGIETRTEKGGAPTAPPQSQRPPPKESAARYGMGGMGKSSPALRRVFTFIASSFPVLRVACPALRGTGITRRLRSGISQPVTAGPEIGFYFHGASPRGADSDTGGQHRSKGWGRSVIHRP